MTDNRRADVWLPADATRCEPSGPCDRRWTCARYLAALPPRGASIADFSLRRQAPILLPFACTEWAAVERQPASAPEPRRHPPIGGADE